MLRFHGRGEEGTRTATRESVVAIGGGAGEVVEVVAVVGQGTVVLGAKEG